MIDKFKDIVGKGNCSDRDLDKFSYRSDASGASGIVEAVVWPKSTEHVQKVVYLAKRLKLGIQIRGGGTSLAGGCVPGKAVVMDMCRMTGIRECREDYVTVESGAVLAKLNRWLEKKGKFFPVVPTSHHACTVGGMIATNASSGKRYGRMGDWVTAVEVVMGNGMLEWFRGEKLKDAIGKEGLTGVITAARLKVIEIPPQGSMEVIRFNTVADLMEEARKVAGREGAVDVTYLDDTCSTMIGLDPFIHLIVHYSGAEGKISDSEEVSHMLGKLEALQSILKSSGFVVTEDPQVKGENAAKFIYELRKSNVPTYGHLFTSVFHPSFKSNDPKREAVKKLAKKLGGSLVGEYGYGSLRKSELSKELEQDFTMLKEIYDPENILNRGKVL